MNNIKSISISLAIASISTFGFVGCGDGGSSSTVSTGTFVDAPVQGLYYKTDTQEGYTNATGEYHYMEGETVEFRLGNLSFGTVTAESLITPYTMAGTDLNNPNAKSTNMAMLLQDFDADRNNSEMIDVTKLKNYSFSNIDLERGSQEMNNQLTSMLATASFQSYVDEMEHDPIDAEVAKETMRNYINGMR